MNEKHIKGVQRASAAVAIAATLAITGGALAGCSGNSNDDNGQVVEESAVVEQGDAGAASADPVMVTKVIQEVTGAYVGKTDDGATVYYALTDDGTQRILAVRAADGTYESWVGNATSNGEEITITDAPSGNTISFRVTPQEGDSARRLHLGLMADRSMPSRQVACDGCLLGARLMIPLAAWACRVGGGPSPCPAGQRLQYG